MFLDCIDIHDRPSVSRKTCLNASEKKELCMILSPHAVIDRKSALERTLGDERFLSELLQAFINGLPGIKKKIEHAVDQGHAGTVAKEAGRLAGAAGNLGATELSDTAFDLELAGRKGRIAEMNRHFRKLLVEVDKIVAPGRPDEFDESRCLNVS